MITAGQNRPLLLGHRGARAVQSLAENTLASFDRALADGGDGFEFDVRLTADRQAVICHDPRSEGVEIACTAAAQLSRLPRLEEVLARYRERAFLDIELKVCGLERMVLEAIAKFPPQQGFVVSSFLPEALSDFPADSGIPRGLICENQRQLCGWSQFSGEYLIPHSSIVDLKFVDEVRGAGKKILVWTVNEAGAMRRFREHGVNGIISDDVNLLRWTLRD